MLAYCVALCFLVVNRMITFGYLVFIGAIVVMVSWVEVNKLAACYMEEACVLVSQAIVICIEYKVHSGKRVLCFEFTT